MGKKKKRKRKKIGRAGILRAQIEQKDKQLSGAGAAIMGASTISFS